MIRTLGIGDNVCDKYLHISTIYPGGNALNVAVFSRMFGAQAAYLGTFGDDMVGKHVYETAAEIGLDLSHCRFEHGNNGCARVQLVNGDRVFLTGNHGGISREKPPALTEMDEEYISGFDLVHTSVYSYLEPQLPAIRRAAKFVSMDFSNRTDDNYLRGCCPYIDCAEISCGDQDEAGIRAAMKKIMDFGCGHIVIATRGSKGAFVQVDGNFYEQSPLLVKARDTMGAGDAFIACFLTNYIDGIKDAVDFGPDSGNRGITTAAEYKDCLIRSSLYRASVFSSAQCQRDGSFGFGKQIDLTEEDRKVMKKESV
ncbi:carbohydrate kinase [Caproiciproducens sp. NJN-50]|uniref:PfkB family carbohydrate kinase n=1 Tax=Caproiciproducens sp. NJN-50 TaxID=2507162 RepID=UPI000FFE1139|nr:PfkB family carbohydrate kinase [Caproiciproducens sp. NJN-50]QAT48963.1 carbohydrate kinase [Caproiciproducens sp. NJN-50]